MSAIQPIRRPALPARRFQILPESALARLDEVIARGRAQPDTWSSQSELREAVADAKSALSAYKDRYGPNANEMELARLQGDVRIAEAAVRAHNNSAGQTASAARAWESTATDCARFVNRLCAAGRMAQEVRVEPRKGATIDSLTSLRGDLSFQLGEIQEAHPPLAEYLQRARARIEFLAADGAPRTAVTHEMSGPHAAAKLRSAMKLVWPTRIQDFQPVLGKEPVEAIDVESVLAWALKDQLLDKCESDLKAFYAGWAGLVLSDSERRAKEKEVRSDALQVERELAVLVWAEADAGNPFARFPEGMHPAALLGIEAVA